MSSKKVAPIPDSATMSGNNKFSLKVLTTTQQQLQSTSPVSPMAHLPEPDVEGNNIAEMARIQQENKDILKTYVRLNPYTLRFSSRELEKDYQIYFDAKRQFMIMSLYWGISVLLQSAAFPTWKSLINGEEVAGDRMFHFGVLQMMTLINAICYFARIKGILGRLGGNASRVLTMKAEAENPTNSAPPKGIIGHAIYAIYQLRSSYLPNDDIIICCNVCAGGALTMMVNDVETCDIGFVFAVTYIAIVLSRLNYIYAFFVQFFILVLFHTSKGATFFSLSSISLVGATMAFTYSARMNELVWRRDFRLTRRLAAENVDVIVDHTTKTWFQAGQASISPANGQVATEISGHIINESELVLKEVLGCGACGEVVAGEWRGSAVAVKKINGVPRQEAIIEFGRESALMAKLRHPCVVLYLGTCLKPLLVVMELMPRGSVFKIIHTQKTVLDWSLRLRMLRDAASGMNFLHLLKDPIIHNDLKSLNLLVDNDWRCKVCDFGFSTIREATVGSESTPMATLVPLVDDIEVGTIKEDEPMEIDHPEEKVGRSHSAKPTVNQLATLGWASPEALQNEPLTEKNDVYAYGVVIFELITYTLPFDSLGREAIPLAVMEGKRPNNFMEFDLAQSYIKDENTREAVEKLVELMTKCWAQDPNDRPVFATVLDELEKILTVYYRGMDEREVVFPNIVKGQGKDVMTLDNNKDSFTINPDDLKLGPKIGSGAYGEVHEALYHGTHVAVKQLFNSGLPADVLKEFYKETRILMDLRHPNIVLFMGSCNRPPKLVIVTELLTRGSLYYQYNSSPKPADKVEHMKLTYQIAEGMALGLNYLHNHNPPIIHRDMKSPNVLLDDHWNAKIGDFGLSRIREEGKIMTSVGSPLWAAPEVLRGEESGFPSDVYSFAVVVWECVAWEEPYPGMSPSSIMRQVAFSNLRPKLTKAYPPELKSLLKSCWADNPKKRPTLAEALPLLESMLEKLNEKDAGETSQGDKTE